MNSTQSNHLDLGCGTSPRNPYEMKNIFGLDIRDLESKHGIVFKKADLNYEKIPFSDNFFDSISAFDYLEHIPRILTSKTNETRFPFIEVMNEVWRTLVDGGRFYALTPCYPALQAFQDPTHVNIITPSTHLYFCGNTPEAAMYGFIGKFKVAKCEWVVHKDSHFARPLNTKQKLSRFIQKKKGKLSHFKWELIAVKSID